jgi:hypothetical protein
MAVRAVLFETFTARTAVLLFTFYHGTDCRATFYTKNEDANK